MGQPIQEPSMEDILASIKRIIAEDSEAAVTRSPRLKKGPVAVPDPVTAPEPVAEAEAEAATPEPAPQPEVHEPSDVLELTSPLIEPDQEPVMAAPKAPPAATEPAAPAQPVAAPAPILSADAATASRNAFAALSQLQVREEGGQSNTLEGLVGDLLRPMLRDWLDANLPTVVERIVEAEVKRLSRG